MLKDTITKIQKTFSIENGKETLIEENRVKMYGDAEIVEEESTYYKALQNYKYIKNYQDRLCIEVRVFDNTFYLTSKTTNYYDEQGRKKETYTYNYTPDEELTNKSIHYYNETEDIEESFSYFYPSDSENPVVYKSIFKENKKENIKEYIHIKIGENNDEPFHHLIEKYDDKNNLLEEICYNNNEIAQHKKNTYAYDDKGNILEKYHYDEDQLVHKEIKHYDDKGKIIASFTYTDKGILSHKMERNDREKSVSQYNDLTGKLAIKAVQIYDENGKCVEHKTTIYEETIHKTHTKYFPTGGNEETISEWDRNGKCLHTNIFSEQEQYDEKGNITEKIFYKNGTPYKREVFLTEYYKAPSAKELAKKVYELVMEEFPQTMERLKYE